MQKVWNKEVGRKRQTEEQKILEELEKEVGKLEKEMGTLEKEERKIRGEAEEEGSKGEGCGF